MKPKITDLETYVDAAAALAGLGIEPERRKAVLVSFEMAAAMAELVLSFPLDEAKDEPSAVFLAGKAR